jgi:hypothetical protein
MRRWQDTADFASRLAFFAVVPFVVLVVAALFPVGMTIANLGVCVLAVLFTDVVRVASRRWPLIERVLGGVMKFEQYYRLHPPKPFAYYIFFPFLFPYWLSVDHARREFLLYKAVNLATLAFVILGAVYQYFAYYRPQLGVSACVQVLLVTLALEIFIVMVMLMPLATSIVRYRLAGKRKRLHALLVVGGLSTLLAIVVLLARRDPVVSWAARERLVLRTQADRASAHRSQHAAAKAAWAAIPTHRAEVDSDGKVTGEAVDAARASLRKFYKEDEAQAFDAWLTRSAKSEVLVLYVETKNKRRPAVFLAMDRSGREVRDPKKLPKGALKAMKLAADGLVLDL